MRSRTETEMTFREYQKYPASAPRLLNILLRKLPGKVLENFQISSETTADYARFRLWGAPACSRRQLADNTFRVASTKSRTGCLGVVVVNCQLSGGADSMT
jgi:hypothetical protein